MENPYNKLGFSKDEAIEALREIENSKKRNGLICICGHSVKAHYNARDRQVCSVAKQDCPCSKAEPVIKVQNARYFLKKTEGGGVYHALGQGIAKLESEGYTWEWYGEPECVPCGAKDVELYPVAVNEVGTEMNEPSRYNALVCVECRKNM